MATPLPAINHAAANDLPNEAGAATLAKDRDGELSSRRSDSDNFHNTTSPNGQLEGPVYIKECPSQHHETTNGMSEPRLSSTTSNAQVKLASIGDDTGDAHQAHVTGPQARGSTSATESYRHAEKRKRSMHTLVKPSSDEALSESNSERGSMVLKFGLNTEETLRRVVVGPKAATSLLRKPSTTEWSFAKLFGDDDFIAAGQVCIHPNCEKPSKNVKDNTYIFFVIEGVIQARIHKTAYTVASGGMFMVPRGNSYSLKNTSNCDARIFFCQARKLPMSEDEEQARDSLLPTRHNGPPTSKAAMLAIWLLHRLIAHIWRLRDRLLVWYKKNLVKYERFATRQRLCLIFFVLGLMVRRLPFIGSPPLINIQFVRVV